jgi:hypothetical protein
MLNNKSITVSTVSTVETASELLTNMYNYSGILRNVTNYTLDAKTTNIPYVKIPAGTDTTYTVESLAVTKALFNIPVSLTDETVEDTNVSIGDQLVKLLTAQTAVKVDDLIIAKIKATPVTTITGTTAILAIKNLITKFNSYVLATATEASPLTVLVSTQSFFTLSGVTADAEFFSNANIRLVGVPGLAANDIIIMQPSGVAVGIDIKGIEKDRQASLGSTTLLVQGTFGMDFSTDYVKRATY